MSAAVLEGEERVNSVSVDGLALLKIVKHCQESLPQMVTGSLLGLNVGNGVLEVTHAFPFPESNKSDLVVKGGDGDAGLDDDAGLDGHEFQMEMMKMLREVNVDNNCVGWYQSMYLGTYSTSALLENQFSYQTDLSPNAVVVLYDPMQTSNGNLALKCYRLTEEAIEKKKTGKNNFLDPKKIFEEVPVNLSNPGLVRALLTDVADGRHGDADGNVYGEDTNFDRLDLSTNAYLEKHLEFLSSWVDDLSAEQMKFQYYTRSLTRGGDHHKHKRRGRDSRDVQAIQEGWKSDDAPKRMESLLISNQIRNYCDQVDSFAGAGFGKLFLAGSLHKEPSK
mmetsp:Transcript_16831/g.39890  ORF Transcript_16831/g.39890 Transcript_16831/m.39890 type:complete len:335 (-) Transcript_16831:23-1027(-)|eukprot:CAMPEP_0185804142 /NCGR_PEP_ID=MMETSP1322-20130828/3081_1 /TAXON_ID=265543 /ORGANISM="Minutocellus polymorphus, Strain RCC2270" /LENGTH=334 /DNA_ID=CAMNT_0028500101 /DNA_START=26 /DNA_END=1030 /DNA_ORIENTATION=+